MWFVKPLSLKSLASIHLQVPLTFTSDCSFFWKEPHLVPHVNQNPSYFVSYYIYDGLYCHLLWGSGNMYAMRCGNVLVAWLMWSYHLVASQHFWTFFLGKANNCILSIMTNWSDRLTWHERVNDLFRIIEIRLRSQVGRGWRAWLKALLYAVPKYGNSKFLDRIATP